MTTATQPDLRQLRVDHTGGFRKPQRLLDAYRRYALGEATDAEVEQLQVECVRELIATELAHNLPILSDGEYRRRQFQESFGEAVKGFDADPGSVYVPAGGPEETPRAAWSPGRRRAVRRSSTADRSPSGWSWSATCRWRSTDSRVR